MADNGAGGLVHVVRLECRDQASAARCLGALGDHGRPDALAYGCLSYEFGPAVEAPATIVLVERWSRWEDLDALLAEKVVPALPLYDEMLARPFDAVRDTTRIALVAVPSQASA
jgi:hypothetical protein